MRTPAAGSTVSEADDRTTISAAPPLAGSTKGPVNVAPASRRTTSPGWAAFSAA